MGILNCKMFVNIALEELAIAVEVYAPKFDAQFCIFACIC